MVDDLYPPTLVWEGSGDGNFLKQDEKKLKE